MRLRNTIHNNKHIRLIPRDLHKIILLRNTSLSLIQQHPLTLSDKVVIHRSHMVLHPRSRAHTIILVPRREIIMRPRQSQPIIKSRHILPSILRPPPPNRLMLILLPRGWTEYMRVRTHLLQYLLILRPILLPLLHIIIRLLILQPMQHPNILLLDPLSLFLPRPKMQTPFDASCIQRKHQTRLCDRVRALIQVLSLSRRLSFLAVEDRAHSFEENSVFAFDLRATI